MSTGTVYNAEGLTFSEEFVVVPRRHPRIVVPNNADLPHGCHGLSTRVLRIFRTGGRRFSVPAGVDLPYGFSLKMAKTRRRSSCTTAPKDRETHLKDRSNYRCENRTYLDM